MSLRRYIDLLFDPPALRALATWPVFSITSYRLVSGLARQGLVPHTVIDVGANVGQFAVACAMIFRDVEVHSFEPLLDASLRLKKYARSLPNLHIYRLALGDKACGNVSMHSNWHSQSSSFLPLAQSHLEAFPEEHETGVAIVEMSTLDEALARVALKPPVWLKLDVQGYEANVIRGATDILKRTDYVITEMSLRPMYEGEMLFTDMLTLLKGHSFNFLRPVSWLTHPRTGEVLQLDGLFAHSTTTSF